MGAMEPWADIPKYRNSPFPHIAGFSVHISKIMHSYLYSTIKTPPKNIWALITIHVLLGHLNQILSEKLQFC